MRTFLCLILFSAIVLSPGIADQTYVSPVVTTAGDAYIPYQNQIVTDGLFVLDVGISEAGENSRAKVQNVGGDSSGVFHGRGSQRLEQITVAS